MITANSVLESIRDVYVSNYRVTILRNGSTNDNIICSITATQIVPYRKIMIFRRNASLCAA